MSLVLDGKQNPEMYFYGAFRVFIAPDTVSIAGISDTKFDTDAPPAGWIDQGSVSDPSIGLETEEFELEVGIPATVDFTAVKKENANVGFGSRRFDAVSFARGLGDSITHTFHATATGSAAGGGTTTSTPLGVGEGVNFTVGQQIAVGAPAQGSENLAVISAINADTLTHSALQVAAAAADEVKAVNASKLNNAQGAAVPEVRLLLVQEDSSSGRQVNMLLPRCKAVVSDFAVNPGDPDNVFTVGAGFKALKVAGQQRPYDVWFANV